MKNYIHVNLLFVTSWMAFYHYFISNKVRSNIRIVFLHAFWSSNSFISRRNRDEFLWEVFPRHFGSEPKYPSFWKIISWSRVFNALLRPKYIPRSGFQLYRQSTIIKFFKNFPGKKQIDVSRAHSQPEISEVFLDELLNNFFKTDINETERKLFISVLNLFLVSKLHFWKIL